MTDDGSCLSFEVAVAQVATWTVKHIDLTEFGIDEDIAQETVGLERIIRAYVNQARFKHEKPTGAGFLEALKECVK